MLDLKELENKLDISLSKETKESITQWVKEKRGCPSLVKKVESECKDWSDEDYDDTERLADIGEIVLEHFGLR
jgi:hypothetical protein